MTIYEQILSYILKYETIIIHRHVIPDGDAYGSSHGLAHLIRHNFKNKNVYVVGEERDYLNHLGRSDVIDNQRYEQALVIITDTSNADRISDERYASGAFKIKIDHHPFSGQYADLEWIDTTYPSTCEMIVDLMVQLQLKTTKDGARCLYNGMVSDTGRFMFRGVSERTLTYGGLLLSYGFDLDELYARMYTRSKDKARFSGYAVLNFEETPQGVAYLKLTQHDLKRLNINEDEASAEVNLLANIEGFGIWAFFVESASNEDIRVNLRSSKAAVNEVAIKYGGGGHRQAAGARVQTWAEVDAVIKDLNLLEK